MSVASMSSLFSMGREMQLKTNADAQSGDATSKNPPFSTPLQRLPHALINHPLPILLHPSHDRIAEMHQ